MQGECPCLCSMNILWQEVKVGRGKGRRGEGLREMRRIRGERQRELCDGVQKSHLEEMRRRLRRGMQKWTEEEAEKEGRGGTRGGKASCLLPVVEIRV